MKLNNNKTKFIEARKIVFTEKQFITANKTGNYKYAKYIEAKLGELYFSFMKKYADNSDHKFSTHKKQKTCIEKNINGSAGC